MRSRSRTSEEQRCGLGWGFPVEGQPCWALASSSGSRRGGKAQAACLEVRVRRGEGWVWEASVPGRQRLQRGGRECGRKGLQKQEG